MNSASNATCRITNTFDNANRLTQTLVTNMLTKSASVNYLWDPAGNPTNITTSLGVTNVLTFDEAERVSTISANRRTLGPDIA